MSVKNTVKAIPLTSIDSAALTGNYQAINPGGLAAPCFLIRLTVDATTAVTFSLDGVTDHLHLLSESSVPYPFQSNAQPNNNNAHLAAGTVIYAKGTAGVGRVYVEGFYQ